MIFAGDGVQAGRYSLGWRDLLPVVLERVEDVPLREQAGWHVREYARDNLIFAAFRQPNSGDLALPVFSRRWALTPVESSQVLARFDDGAPLLVSRTVGAGRVMLVNTSVDTRWNDWPKRKTFVPWLHGVANFAAGEGFTEKGRDSSRFLAGTATEIDLGRDAARKPFLLQTPGSTNTIVIADAEGRLPMVAGPPGFYSLSETNGRLARMFAANLPSAESDLSAWTLQEFQQQLAQTAADSGTGPAAWVNPELRDREFWRMILAAGLVLLCLEIVAVAARCADGAAKGRLAVERYHLQPDGGEARRHRDARWKRSGDPSGVSRSSATRSATALAIGAASWMAERRTHQNQSSCLGSHPEGPAGHDSLPGFGQ